MGRESYLRKRSNCSIIRRRPLCVSSDDLRLGSLSLHNRYVALAVPSILKANVYYSVDDYEAFVVGAGGRRTGGRAVDDCRSSNKL